LLHCSATGESQSAASAFRKHGKPENLEKLHNSKRLGKCQGICKKAEKNQEFV